MQNLLEETLDALNVKTINEAAQIIEWANISMSFKEIKDRALAPSHTAEEAVAFLKAMNKVYDNDGSGTIKLKDGTWLERILEWDEDDDDNVWSTCEWEWVHCKPVTHNYSGPEFESYITH